VTTVSKVLLLVLIVLAVAIYLFKVYYVDPPAYASKRSS